MPKEFKKTIRIPWELHVRILREMVIREQKTGEKVTSQQIIIERVIDSYNMEGPKLPDSLTYYDKFRRRRREFESSEEGILYQSYLDEYVEMMTKAGYTSNEGESNNE